MPNFPLFESPRAHALLLSGDIATAARWLGYARQHLQGLLARHSAATTITLKPVPGVTIQVFTKPNRILIFAGGSSLLIHGFLSYALDSEFIVYDGSDPAKYLNPIALTTAVTAALSTKMSNGSARPTFPRYRVLSNNEVVCFGGYADPYNRMSKVYSVPGGFGGYIMHRGKLVYVGGSSILDVGLVSGKLGVLYYTRVSASNRYVTLAYVDVATGTVSDIFSVFVTRTTGTASRYGFTVTAEKYPIPGVQIGQALTLLTKTADTIGTPAGASARYTSISPVVEIMDARFSVDDTSVSILAGLTENVWNMSSEIGELSPSDPGGGRKEFTSLMDLVVLPLAEWTTPVEMLDPFGGISASTPVTYAFYNHQGITRSEKKTVTVNSYTDAVSIHFSNAYTHPHFGAGNTSSLIAGGGGWGFSVTLGVPPVSITSEGAIDSLFTVEINPSNIPDGVVSFTWDGAASIAWNALGDDPNNISAYYGFNGNVSKQYTMVIDYGHPYVGRPDLGVVTTIATVSYPCTRTTVESATLNASISRVFTFSGTRYIGYSFDIDNESLTYGARQFVELGYKAEPLSAINTSSTIEMTTTIVNSHKEFVGVPPDSTYVLPNSRDYSYELAVSKGGLFALSVYVGGKAISRVLDVEGIPTGYTYSCNSTADYEATIIEFGYSYSHINKTLEVSASYPQNILAIQPTNGLSTSLNSLPVSFLYAGGSDYDRGTGVYYIYGYSSSSGNFPNGSITPTNKAADYPTYSILTVPGSSKAANTSHTAISPYGEVTFNKLSEIGPQLPASSLSSIGTYYATTPDTTRGSSTSSGYKIYLPGGKSSYVGVPSSGIYALTAPGPSYEWTMYDDVLGTGPYTAYTAVSPYYYNTGEATKIPLKDSLGNDASQVVVIYSSEDGAISNAVSTDFPITHTQFSRGGIAVFDTAGTKLADTKVFPDGSNPSVPENEYTRKVIAGYSLKEG